MEGSQSCFNLAFKFNLRHYKKAPGLHSQLQLQLAEQQAQQEVRT